MAVALRAVAEQLNNGAAEQAARRALARVRVFFDGERWGPQFDLLGGNAGIALGALRVGYVELAEAAVTPYLRTAEVTSHGVTWENRTGLAARRHHLAHGTLGVAYALAVTAHATRRADPMDLALAGVADGVLALACDRAVERGKWLAFGDVLVTDLAARATIDAAGVRWRNHEHRVAPSTLEPRTGWAMGNAGIVRELLRCAHPGWRRSLCTPLPGPTTPRSPAKPAPPSQSSPRTSCCHERWPAWP